MKFKSIALLSLLATVLTLSSCANIKKKTTDGTADTSSDTGSMKDGKNDGMSLELNGDSDSNKAGALKTVYFDFNSAGLSADTKETLNNNAQFLKSNPNVKIQVEGHTDERGGVQFNLSLGEKRAKTVREYLVGLGVQVARIATISLGKEKPVSFGHDEESWSKNRRANFVVTTK
ncbi:MAG: peptidoglycan-associated lipoprotein Pal [Bacteriovorax sp.]|nr:peptidoglycan-associated lipoprotein Pal [Bacteriovorax sp.]